MKKIVRTIGLASMAALLMSVSSCKKDEGNGDVMIKVSVPEMEALEVEGGRAYIDTHYQFHWNANDQVRVYNLSQDANQSTSGVFRNISGEGVQSAYFTGGSVGRKKDLGYFLAYPAMRALENPVLLKNENRADFQLSENQTYACYVNSAHPYSLVDGTAMLMAVNTDNLMSELTFRHVCGCARIGFNTDTGQDVYVKRVTIIDNSFNLTGTAQVKVHAVNVEKLQALINLYKAGNDAAYATQFQSYVIDTLGYNAQLTGKSITMECFVMDDNLQTHPVKLENSGSGYTYFNFMLRPLALSNGFTVEITLCDENGFNEEIHTIDRWAHPADRRYVSEPGKVKTFTYPFPFSLGNNND